MSHDYNDDANPINQCANTLARTIVLEWQDGAPDGYGPAELESLVATALTDAALAAQARIAELEAEVQSLASHYAEDMRRTAATRQALEARLAAVCDALAPALALEPRATPGPWRECAESGDWWVEGADEIGVCESNEAWNHQADIDLTIALRNALPAVAAALEGAER